MEEEERQKSKYSKNEITQVFTQNQVTYNPEDKFEFPDLHEGKKIDKDDQAPVIAEENKWSAFESLTIQNNKSKKEKLQEEFPDLEDDKGAPRMDFNKTKPSKMD